MIVLDASAVIDLLLNRSPAGPRVARRILADAPALIAPHLIDAEVGQVLRRFTLAGGISAQRAGYDALYLALSEAADAPLVTCDRRLAKVPGVRASVEVLW